MRARIHHLAAAAVLLTGMSGSAQYDRGYNNHEHHQQFYNGVRQGGRGEYYSQGRDRDYHQGGIGPGKGALIGGAGGAALGAVLGGGLKGTIIGGAAGAGIGAALGQAHQNNERRDYYGHR